MEQPREIEFKVLHRFPDRPEWTLVGYERLNEKGEWEQMRDRRKEWLLGVITDNQGTAEFKRLQYIGISDRDKVKIYAGDIIKGTAILSDDYGYNSSFEVRGEVQYNEEYSAWAFTDYIKSPVENYYSLMYQLDGMETEVIGNIYLDAKTVEP